MPRQEWLSSAVYPRGVPRGLEDNGAPFHFSVKIHFDEAGAGKTDFWVEVDAELNGILKMMLGGKIQEALDKMVDGMVGATAQV